MQELPHCSNNGIFRVARHPNIFRYMPTWIWSIFKVRNSRFSFRNNTAVIWIFAWHEMLAVCAEPSARPTTGLNVQHIGCLDSIRAIYSSSDVWWIIALRNMGLHLTGYCRCRWGILHTHTNKHQFNTFLMLMRECNLPYACGIARTRVSHTHTRTICAKPDRLNNALIWKRINPFTLFSFDTTFYTFYEFIRMACAGESRWLLNFWTATATADESRTEQQIAADGG